jgi:hypothetical protein
MPSWKKIIISGSDAALNSLNVSTSFTASGLIYPTSDNGEESFMQTDGNGNLSFQYVKTIYETVYNGEATQIAKGTPLYISGSVGAASIVYRADAANPAKMPVIYIAADNIASRNTGRGILLGLITGVNTTGYPPGTEIFVAAGGGWTSTKPTGSAIVQLLGVITKEGPGGQGVILNPGPFNIPNITPGNVWVGNSNSIPTPTSTSSLSVFSAVSSSYSDYALISGNGFPFTGSALITGSLTITGSLSTTQDSRINKLNIGNGGGDFIDNIILGGTTILGSPLSSNTTGRNNVAIGQGPLVSNTTGNRNIALGNLALSNNEDGNNNIALGFFSLIDNIDGDNNIALGGVSLQLNTTGNRNISIGANAMNSNVTGSDNIALGSQALFNTEGSNNIGIGYLTEVNDPLDDNSIVIGYNTTGLGSNTTIIGNGSTITSAIYGNLLLGTLVDNNIDRLQVSGSILFNGNTTITGSLNVSGTINLSNGTQNTLFSNLGTDNLFIGNNVGTNTTGSNNVFIGSNVGQITTTISSAVFIGSNSGQNAIGGGVFIGSNTGQNNTGAGSTFIGTNSGQNNTSGNGNTFIGFNSGQNNTTSFNNTFVGGNSGINLSSGNNNVFFGNNAGRYIANGSTSLTSSTSSIFIGSNTKALSNSQTNQIVIGHNSTGLGSNTTLIGTTSTVISAIYGRLLLGTTIDNNIDRLQVSGSTRIVGNTTITGSALITGSLGVTGSITNTTSITSPIFYDSANTDFYFDGSNTGNSIQVAGDIVGYFSDDRLKNRKGNIPNAIEKVQSLNGFYYKPNKTAQEFGYKNQLEIGVSAQEVEKVLPEIIKDAPIGHGYKTLNYGRLTPLLIEAIKEQQKQIEELKKLVNKLINK